jgi:Capsule assembly protein Wzi
MMYRRITLLTVTIIAATCASYAGVLPVGQPQYDFLYDRMTCDYLRSGNGRNIICAPVWIDSANQLVSPMNLWSSGGNTQELNLFSFAQENYSISKDNRSLAYESIRGGFSATPTSKLFVFGSLSLDEQKARDSRYTGKKWRGLAGGIDQAFVAYAIGNFSGTLGRFSEYWGDSRSLALSSRVAMDGLGYHYRWGRLSLSYRLARLDGLSPERDGVAEFENRYFAAHRLDLRLSQKIRVGLYEMVVFGGPGRQIDLYYLNPILLYHASQLNEKSDDNTILGFDVTIHPRKGTRLHAELLVDDFQLDNKVQSDNEPDEIAIAGSIYQADVSHGCDLIARYERVTNRTFNQALARNRYTHEGRLIGGALGNDYDRMEFSIRRWMSPSWLVDLQSSYHRQGEGNIDDSWSTPWMDISGSYSESFPTGVVEQTATFALRSAGFVKNFLYFDISAGVQNIKNEGHDLSSAVARPFVSISLSPFGFTRLSVSD